MKGPTKDTHLGRPTKGRRLINPSVECGSTVLFSSYDDFRANRPPWHYGRTGTPTHRALEESLCDLEGADNVVLTGSGLEACTLAILSCVTAGGHVLVTDSAYEPTRTFCDGLLRGFDIETTYFDPQAGREEIAALCRPTTQLIFCESPGSLTFEVQDLPAIVAGAGEVPVAVDNTYGAGVLLRPLELGCAISVQALTKYVGGHSDLLLGAVATAPRLSAKVRRMARMLGISVSGRDVAMAHRGLRTLHRRLAVHEENGLGLARFLETHSAIRRVLHPGLDSHPQAALWARDASGTNGLFSVIADWEDEAVTARFIDHLTLFGLGYSWGGYESLCLPAWPTANRTAVPWTEGGQVLRFHAGLEDLDDLIEDVAAALAAATST
ncbi:Cystathionine beta-lyase [Parvularcula bermudensis HTCC2503]|uniref:Cystathionine beta-lyase n=1 Tax=Parvularcula bermudensis (strain ATCC BAA-594 / HTCC2503 / KCTC 12087) TaxID=314260 RepID=E0TDW7_PARBH|nr:cystathionine beta-lyase [Parvularcula bermudensis]ADM10416.1 Cystathionine beta-lyase [Parvularcula bermudensis HTCC2503]